LEYVVLGAVLIAATVIGVDAVRQRRRLRDRPDTRRILATRIQVAGAGPDVLALLGTRRVSPAATATVHVPRVEPRKEDGGPASGASLDGVWANVRRILDPENFRPRLVEGTQIRVFRLRWGDDYAIVASPGSTQHLRLEPWEAEMVQRMDGTRSVSELIVERLQEDGDLDTNGVISLVDLLRKAGILEPRAIDLPGSIADRLDPASPGRRRLREFGRTLQIEWKGAERIANAAYRGGLRLAFRPLGLAIVIAVALGGVLAFIAVVRSGNFELNLRAAPAEAAILLALGFFLTFVHELGHALVMVHYDRRVLSAGFLIYFGSPAFFIDASDVLLLDGRKRMVQSLGGPLAETFVAGIASIVLFLVPDVAAGSLLYRFAFVNYFIVLENLVPLLELDGYYILSDLIELPDLRPRSLEFLRSELWHKLRVRQRFSVQEIGLGIYGVLGVLFTIFSLWVGLYFWQQLFGNLISDLWKGGLGSRLLLLVLAVFFAGPILRAGIALARAVARRVKGYVDTIRFRVERSWRIEAAELIDELPAFDDLPEDLLSALAGRVRLRSLPPGRAVFRQGDRPEAFYVIRSGTMNVEDEDPETGDTRVIRTLGRGDSFGELGLLSSAARQATVRAITNVELFEVGKGTFDRLLMDEMRAPDFGPTLQSFVELRELGPFRRLSSDELATILEHGTWTRHAPSQAVIAQGEPGDAFYAIAAGRADVDIDGRRIKELGPGDHFGELALLDDAPRSASVIARTPMRAFRLDREGFDTVIAGGFRRDREQSTGRSLEH
jgi:CRP-like cAMP-binding protein/Zn-dependent protease